MVKPGKHTEIGEIPKDWGLQSFEETFCILSNNTLPRADLNSRGGQIRNVHYGDLLTRFPEVLDCGACDIPYLNSSSLLTASAQLLQDGDVILADTAEDETVGKATEVYGLGKDKLVAGLHTIPCRVRRGNFAPKWLGYYMNSKAYHDQILPFITGIKVSSISKTGISDTLILVPPVKEQAAMVEILSDMDQVIRVLKRDIDKLRIFKQAQLQVMFPQKGEWVPQVRLPGFTGEWERHKLEEIASVHDGVHQTPEYTESGVMFVSVEDIETLKSEKYISQEAFQRDYKVYPEKGDILMTRIGDVGSSNVVEGREKLAFYVSLALLKPKGVDSCFLCNAIRSPLFQKGLKDRTLITAIPQKINKEEIGKVDVWIPAEEQEQRQIGAHFQHLDHLITLHQQKLKKYTELKQGMMSNLFTGKIRRI